MHQFVNTKLFRYLECHFFLLTIFLFDYKFVTFFLNKKKKLNTDIEWQIVFRALERSGVPNFTMVNGNSWIASGFFYIVAEESEICVHRSIEKLYDVTVVKVRVCDVCVCICVRCNSPLKATLCDCTAVVSTTTTIKDRKPPIHNFSPRFRQSAACAAWWKYYALLGR